MKRVLSLVLVAGVAFLLGHFLRAPIPLAGAAGDGTLPVSGDANGDGMLNIADPVYLCRFLFSDGPAPVPIACPPTVLLATGQTMCFDQSDPANEIPCDNADFPGQDGFYRAGCPPEGRFVDHGDGTVTDNCTGFMWQKDTADVSGNGTLGNEDAVDWQAALKYCDSLEFAGHTDWRLPNIYELQSIVDYARFDPAIDPVLGAASWLYWSSSTLKGYPAFAWIVYLVYGSVDDHGKGGISLVRAVRNAP